jgi:hypothetical protein
MSTIIQKQYETAKQILSAVEMNFRSYEICGRTQKDFDYFYDIATSLLTIVGNVHIGTKVCQAQRENGVSIIDECRQMFAAYEAELMQAGLIPSKWEQILADIDDAIVSIKQHTEYTEEQEAQMWHEHQKQMDYDPQF